MPETDAKFDVFLHLLDEIEEVAHDFIGDDGLTESPGYVADLAAVYQLRETYKGAYQDLMHPGEARSLRQTFDDLGIDFDSSVR
jgi:hypothetical protein